MTIIFCNLFFWMTSYQHFISATIMNALTQQFCHLIILIRTQIFLLFLSALKGAIVKDPCGRTYTGPRGLAEVGANSNFQTSSYKGKQIMFYPKPMTRVLPSRPADTGLENQPKRPKLRPLEPCGLRYEDLAVLSRMPTVTTTGDGPGGKRIQGFLYTYRGGQVSIVCVCHGSFLTPEEFVRHAGGIDVANPMKLITVCSNPF